MHREEEGIEVTKIAGYSSNAMKGGRNGYFFEN